MSLFVYLLGWELKYSKPGKISKEFANSFPWVLLAGAQEWAEVKNLTFRHVGPGLGWSWFCLTCSDRHWGTSSLAKNTGIKMHTCEHYFPKSYLGISLDVIVVL